MYKRPDTVLVITVPAFPDIKLTALCYTGGLINVFEVREGDFHALVGKYGVVPSGYG
jgi:hypothetical protein